MAAIPNVMLNDGRDIPQLGFGVFQIPQEETARAVATAFGAGIRHIDTAQMYGNEEGVGQAIRDSGLSRDELFVTTKLDNDRHGTDEAVKALDESLTRLGLDHVDLYLIHWPRPAEDRYVATWKGFEKVVEQGKARSIGVSNFQVPHLARLAAETDTVPAVNQIELHPYLQQTTLREYHRQNGIATEAWSPLGQGGDLLHDPTLAELATKYGKTPAQIVLRWHLQLDNIVFPKSVTPERVRENVDVLDVDIAADDLAAISALDRGERMGPDPDDFG